MRVALIQDFLVHMRGAERFLSLLCRIFPTADVYTLVADQRVVATEWRHHRVKESFVGRLPFARKTFRALMPLYPHAIEQFDLSGYDLVISCSMGFAHGVITQPGTCHICCLHTPFRYAWNWYHTFLAGRRGPSTVLYHLLLHHLRQWDRQAADRVDYFVANSRITQQRIQKFYRRQAEVLHYPIDGAAFHLADHPGEYYLIVSALMPYKRLDLAVEAFTRLRLPLKIIGTGPELGRLRSLAGPSVEFLGVQPDRVVRAAYARCRAFVVTAHEDYGLTPLEAQASGRPVIAYGAGGVLETVVDGVTGTFYHEQTVDALARAVIAFDPARFDPPTIRAHALQFDLPVFQRQLIAFVQQCLSAHRNTYGLPALALPDAEAPRPDRLGGLLGQPAPTELLLSGRQR